MDFYRENGPLNSLSAALGPHLRLERPSGPLAVVVLPKSVSLATLATGVATVAAGADV